MRSSNAFAVEERYTRTGEDEILFQYTVTDANIYSQPFTAQILCAEWLPDKGFMSTLVTKVTTLFLRCCAPQGWKNKGF